MIMVSKDSDELNENDEFSDKLSGLIRENR